MERNSVSNYFKTRDRYNFRFETAICSFLEPVHVETASITVSIDPYESTIKTRAKFDSVLLRSVSVLGLYLRTDYFNMVVAILISGVRPSDKS
jgi:hypothetical protein